jgi:hypothetical protein
MFLDKGTKELWMHKTFLKKSRPTKNQPEPKIRKFFSIFSRISDTKIRYLKYRAYE